MTLLSAVPNDCSLNVTDLTIRSGRTPKAKISLKTLLLVATQTSRENKTYQRVDFNSLTFRGRAFCGRIALVVTRLWSTAYREGINLLRDGGIGELVLGEGQRGARYCGGLPFGEIVMRRCALGLWSICDGCWEVTSDSRCKRVDSDESSSEEEATSHCFGILKVESTRAQRRTVETKTTGRP